MASILAQLLNARRACQLSHWHHKDTESFVGRYVRSPLQRGEPIRLMQPKLVCGPKLEEELWRCVTEGEIATIAGGITTEGMRRYRIRLPWATERCAQGASSSSASNGRFVAKVNSRRRRDSVRHSRTACSLSHALSPPTAPSLLRIDHLGT